ncbi:hypothetical protein U3A55_05510 [Salarchaeum sp. III]|uniref:hypothetical protein n=1 Tax=Salarchaeum sp. III TaxID=3107927 RepID=UPI002EDAF466
MSAGTAKDAFEAGVALAGAVFLLVYLSLLQNADSVTQAIDVFGRTFYTFVMAFFPTSKLAVFLDLLMGTVGASIAASKLRARGIGILIAFGFAWTATNIVLNWLNSPI